jgi:hypothetical protein
MENFRKQMDEEDTFTDRDLAGGDEYEGLDKAKYMLGLLLGKMSSDPDAAKYTNHLDKILVMMQGVGLSEEQKLDEAAMSSDEARDKAIGTLKSLSKQVDDKQVTAFLTEVKKWIDWTL